MKKYVSDLRVVSVEHINEKYVLIKLTQAERLPEMLPGQFVEVRVDGSPSTFLRRPISVNFVDYEAATALRCLPTVRKRCCWWVAA